MSKITKYRNFLGFCSWEIQGARRGWLGKRHPVLWMKNEVGRIWVDLWESLEICVIRNQFLLSRVGIPLLPFQLVVSVSLPGKAASQLTCSDLEGYHRLGPWVLSGGALAPPKPQKWQVVSPFSTHDVSWSLCFHEDSHYCMEIERILLSVFAPLCETLKGLV